MCRYKIEICKSPNWQSYDAVTLGVSIESHNWRGEKLASILEFVARRFRSVRIDVTDALYRHKIMAAGVEKEKAYAGADALGSLWLSQHQELIDGCSIKPKIVRWSEWYRHPDYIDTIGIFKKAFEESKIFREALEHDVAVFCKRQKNVITSQTMKHSADFLIEEVAVISLQAKELASLRIYPGKELECLKSVRAGAVYGVPCWLQNEQFAKFKFKLRA